MSSAMPGERRLFPGSLTFLFLSGEQTSGCVGTGGVCIPGDRSVVSKKKSRSAKLHCQDHPDRPGTILPKRPERPVTSFTAAGRTPPTLTSAPAPPAHSAHCTTGPARHIGNAIDTLEPSFTLYYSCLVHAIPSSALIAGSCGGCSCHHVVCHSQFAGHAEHG